MPDLQDRVLLSARDAMDRELQAIALSVDYLLNYLYETNETGIILLVQGEYPEETREAIRQAAVHLGISVSFRRGVIAIPDQIDPTGDSS